MSGQDFAALSESGLLKDVEEIVVGAYRSIRPQASLPAAYRWLRYEDPEPVARLADGVRRLRKSGARFEVRAVDKACAKAAELGFLN